MPTTKTVELIVNLTDFDAWNLAQWLKRVSFSDFRSNATDNDEAYAMRDAAERVRTALRNLGVCASIVRSLGRPIREGARYLLDPPPPARLPHHEGRRAVSRKAPFQLTTKVCAHGDHRGDTEFAVYILRSDWHAPTQQYLFTDLARVGTFRAPPIDAASHASELQRLVR